MWQRALPFDQQYKQLDQNIDPLIKNDRAYVKFRYQIIDSCLNVLSVLVAMNTYALKNEKIAQKSP